MSQSEKFWDRLSKNYDKADKVDAVKEYESIGRIKKLLNSNDVVLDFGCATGTVAFAIADNVKEVQGIDISARMIQIAIERASERKSKNVYFSQSSILDEQFENNSFNMILAFSVLHLVEDLDIILQRINALLKPGCYFVSLTPCLGEKMFLSPFLKFLHGLRILPKIHGYKTDELVKLIENQKFQIVENRCLDHNPLEYFIIAQKV